ncbi:MAG: hypothetical protein ACTSVR_03285 [Candidatus Thorarchaeota archaeon]
MKIVVKGVPTGRTWNYQRIAEHIKRDVSELLEKNIDSVEEIITRNKGTLKIVLNKEEVEKYAKLGKEKMPAFRGQQFRVRKAIEDELGWKARRQGDTVVIYLDAPTLQELLGETTE